MLARLSQDAISLPVSVRRALKVFAVLTLLCLLAELVSRFHYHYGFPYIWPLQTFYPPFADFNFFKPRVSVFHTRAFFAASPPFNYPATLGVVLEALFLMPAPVPTFLFMIMLGFILGAAVMVRALWREGLSIPGIVALLAAFFASIPLWFEFEQANIEALVLLLIALGLWTFLKHRPYAAAACFSIAASMKLFPFVFLALLLVRRKYRALVFGCVAAVTFTVACLWLETGSISASWYGTNAGLESFRQHYTLTLNGFDHSLFELAKRLVWIGQTLHHGPVKIPATVAASMLRFYMPVVALTGIVIFCARIRKLPVVNQILALTVASIVLPPVSFEYTLIHLFVPSALLVLVAIRSAKRGAPVPGLAAALLTVAVLLAPETEVILRGMTLEGEIKCLALLTLFFLAVRYPFVLEPVSSPEATIHVNHSLDAAPLERPSVVCP